MLNKFDNETENGKLYISYPMVEALKHLRKNKIATENYIAKIKENVNYKELVSENSDFTDLRKIKYEDWELIISENLKRCLFLFEVEETTQEKIKNIYSFLHKPTFYCRFECWFENRLKKEKKVIK
ncbi:hypothetical protein OCK72_06720 [Fusobacterium simiae]|uniref:Uncharacterized protein n=1 Tax=Fusobacterium simiae TaxID=855 RepID=A0ABT4DIB3_FUSSI|nr:hypothetical protein [Fusobacterium simiae]MCY7008347.1 hypothetical protein [Fusobacterium simiae]